MKMPVSWLVNNGLSVGDGFSSKREAAQFKQRLQALKDELGLGSPSNKQNVGPKGVHLSQEEYDRGTVVALLVEDALIDLATQARQLGPIIDEAKAKGELDKAADLIGQLMVRLVPHVRNKILTMMATIEKDDVHALRRLLRALDKVEEVRSEAAKAAPAA